MRKTCLLRSSGVCTLDGVNSACREMNVTRPAKRRLGNESTRTATLSSICRVELVFGHERTDPQFGWIADRDEGGVGADEVSGPQLDRFDDAGQRSADRQFCDLSLDRSDRRPRRRHDRFGLGDVFGARAGFEQGELLPGFSEAGAGFGDFLGARAFLEQREFVARLCAPGFGDGGRARHLVHFLVGGLALLEELLHAVEVFLRLDPFGLGESQAVFGDLDFEWAGTGDDFVERGPSAVAGRAGLFDLLGSGAGALAMERGLARGEFGAGLREPFGQVVRLELDKHVAGLDELTLDGLNAVDAAADPRADADLMRLHKAGDEVGGLTLLAPDQRQQRDDGDRDDDQQAFHGV